jgi:hypothetical protein
MAAKQPMVLGQRFRDVRRGSFGPSGLEWMIEALLTGVDGIAYARLISVQDRTQRKTLSVEVLSDKRWFVRVEV